MVFPPVFYVNIGIQGQYLIFEKAKNVAGASFDKQFDIVVVRTASILFRKIIILLSFYYFSAVSQNKTIVKLSEAVTLGKLNS